MNERLAELLLAWEDDTLSEVEADEFADLLGNDSAARANAVDHFSLSCAIGEQLQESLHDESVVRELQRMPTVARSASEGPSASRPRSRVGLLITVAVLLMVGFIGYRFDVHKLILDKLGGQAVVNVEDLRPKVTDTFGDVQIVRADDSTNNIVEGATLGLGHSLRTSKNSYATLLFPDGTKFELRGDTHIRIEPLRSGKHLTLQRGGLFASVAPQPKGAPLVINPDSYDRVEVVGTRFEFVRDATTSVVRVETGKVEFGATERAVEVTKRRESTASSDQQATAPRPIEPETIWRGWGHGLRGDYYDSSSFGGQHFARIDPRIDFHWGKQVPDSSFKNEFSVRWTGEIEVPQSGEYTFWTVAHYGVRLSVNGESLINSWASMGAEEDGRPIELVKGKRYPIEIEYWDRHGNAKMRLLWSSPSMPKSVVDQQWLYPANNENSDAEDK